jgi:hypothetical protein
MQACIEEWRTGSLIEEHLNASDQYGMFTTHLLGLEEYAAVAPRRMRKFQRRWYRAGR